MSNTNKEIEAWLAIRKEAAKGIHPATAKVFMERGNIGDPYGIVPDDEERCIGKIYYARAPGSDVCVAFDDLPESVVDELWKRLECNDPDGPSPFDPDLPNVNRLVVEIMARDDGEPGYALAVARSIAAHLGDGYPEMKGFLKRTAEPTASAARG